VRLIALCAAKLGRTTFKESETTELRGFINITKSAAPALAALALILGCTVQAKADFIVNGGFETGDFNGWTVSAGFTSVTGPFDGFNPHGGNFFAALGNVGGLGTLSQTIVDNPGQLDTLSLYLGSDGGIPNEFKVEFNGVVLYDQLNLPDTRGNSSQYNLLSFTVAGTGSDTLTLFERNDPGYLALDDVSLNPAASANPVPEPASLVLAGLGAASMLGYAGLRRREKPATAA
jgi:hypothetical protein